MYPHDSSCEQIPRTNSKTTHIKNNHQTTTGPRRRRTSRRGPVIYLWQHRTIPALRLKHRSGGYGTATALPKCSIMSGCGTRIVLRGQKPLALCDCCPCFGSLFPPLAALTFAASSIICAFGLAAAAPHSPYRHAVSALRIMRYCPRLFNAKSGCVCRNRRYFRLFRYTLAQRRNFPSFRSCIRINSSIIHKYSKSMHKYWIQHFAARWLPAPPEIVHFSSLHFTVFPDILTP